MKTKLLLLAMLLVGTVSVTTGCKKTPYVLNDEMNYTVSVKYDANGGTFAENSSIIVDSYNISEMQADQNGNVNIPLISPDNEDRGNDAFTAQRNGYFFAGWYAQRTQTGVDEKGNPVYTYSDKWDFESDRLTLKKDDTYTATVPELTLYAAWIPLFKVEIYSLQTGELLEVMTMNPINKPALEIPQWSEETGSVVVNDFPKVEGYTYNGIYLDAEGKNPVTELTMAHSGVVNYENGTGKDSVMKVYADMLEGDWYRIYTVDQFLKNTNVGGNYDIYADLDFEGVTWPAAFVYGNFTGTINGNGHTFKNIEIVQNKNDKMYGGMFGNITDKANISDLTFENVEFTIEAGARVPSASFGLFAGYISGDAAITNVQILSSTLNIDANSYFAYDDYSIGLLCGGGNTAVVENAEITCTVVGDDEGEILQITIDGNKVTLEFLE